MTTHSTYAKIREPKPMQLWESHLNDGYEEIVLLICETHYGGIVARRLNDNRLIVISHSLLKHKYHYSH